MADAQEDVITDDLFVGLTRPATMLGIPMMAFVLEIMATTLIFLAVGNPLYLLFAAPIHAVMYLISSSNTRVFSEMAIWMKTKSRCMNTRFWGASSFSPRKTKKWID